mgnify:CR=1 FL=1
MPDTPLDRAAEDPAPGLPEHVRENRAYWDGMADRWVAAGKRAWAAEAPVWGIWSVPERDVGMLPEDMRGMHAIELGCGTAYVSGWMARRGARVVGIDNSERQLATARSLADRHGVPLTLIHGNAESVPLPDASFDFAVSEYGAAIWCDPYRWIPEARRLLRPGGRLVFLGGTPLSQVCSPLDGSPCEPRLHRDYFGLHRLDWTRVAVDPGGVEFNLPVSGWWRLFRETGFVVEDYLELQAPAEAADRSPSIPVAWARRWPAEQVWKVRACDAARRS